MSDIIQLLPDSIANQIAAGEVIQRPASVVKELIENAIDAESTTIQLIIKDAGRTLIQVIDNGKGMSPTDARMAFERHATSKIKQADDLFSLKTMGFRGEALPSIAAVAQIELKTKKEEDQLGTLLRISASRVEQQEAIACSNGSNFAVRNIFFNVPARRKFLKGNDTEKRNIMTELERIAMVNPQIEFIVIDNGVESLHLTPCNQMRRILQLQGKSFAQKLIPVAIETSLVNITGFIGTPDSARKVRAQQFFFVNGRYMRHPYFAKAVSMAFEHLIMPGENPNFFLFLQVEPDTIDVNIHPTKTEIKFENELPIWQIIHAVVKEALGKNNEAPPLDFNMKDAIDIPIYNPERPISKPQIKLTPDYNPFKNSGNPAYESKNNYNGSPSKWEKLYENFQKHATPSIANASPAEQSSLNFSDSSADMDNKHMDEQSALKQASHKQDAAGADSSEDGHTSLYLQYKNRYILTPVKSGLMLIDQHRAHVSILFHQFMEHIRRHTGVSQRVLFPEVVEFSPSEMTIIPHIADDLSAIGFELNSLGNNAYAVTAIPAEIETANPSELIRNIIAKSIETNYNIKTEIQERIALSLAQESAIKRDRKLSEKEMETIISRLFSLPTPNHTPEGKTVITIIKHEDIAKLFK